MSIESIDYDETGVLKLNVEQLELSAELADHIDDFAEVLEPEEFERFLLLTPDQHNMVLTTAYLRGIDDPTERNARIMAAYLNYFSDGASMEEASARFGVTESEVEITALHMPDFLADAVPGILRRDIGRAATGNVIQVAFTTIEAQDDTDEEAEEPFEAGEIEEPIPLVVNNASEQDQAETSDDKTTESETSEESEQENAPEAKVAFDKEFDFFTTAKELDGSYEWKIQGRALFDLLKEKGLISDDIAEAVWAHLGKDEKRTKRINNALDKLGKASNARQAALHSRTMFGASFSVLSAELFKKPSDQASSHLDRLASRLVYGRTNAKPDKEQARCVAFGLIREQYRPELDA